MPWRGSGARSTSRKVTHPNVRRIFDLGFDRRLVDGREVDTVFLTMELLRGETLAERIRQCGRLSTAEALPLVAQMAAELDAAHRAGVVHRDFRSANVILVRFERAVAVEPEFALRHAALSIEAVDRGMIHLLRGELDAAPEKFVGACTRFERAGDRHRHP